MEVITMTMDDSRHMADALLRVHLNHTSPTLPNHTVHALLVRFGAAMYNCGRTDFEDAQASLCADNEALHNDYVQDMAAIRRFVQVNPIS
jgi:hypothetical protein